MPEVVDSCSLASPASVCQTKHLHLRCGIDFARRVLTGTAALTVQSQEDSLRSLVRWGLLPGARLSLAPRLPSLTPPRPFPAPAPPASRIRRRSRAARSPVLQLPLGLRSFSAPVFSPPRTRVDASQPNWSLCLPSVPTMCTCLSSTPFPQPPSQFLDTSRCPFHAPLRTRR